MKTSLKQKPSPEKKKLENIEEGEEIKEEVKEVKEATPSSKYERSSSSDGNQGTNVNAKEEKKDLLGALDGFEDDLAIEDLDNDVQDIKADASLIADINKLRQHSAILLGD